MPVCECTPAQLDAATGRRVREVRNMRGMSQEALGDHCGITFQQIQKYEKGTNRIGPSRLMKIAEKLGVAVSHFYPDQTNTGPAPALSDYALKAATTMDQIPPGQRSLALSILRQFVA